MPPHSMSGRESPDTAASAAASLPLEDAQGADMEPESDFTRLANRLAEHGQGIFSLQLSADLALEIVLNEIVEQACLTMRATGAAIILEREGELVCRACSGSTAPGLGTRLDTTIGLSGECVQTLHSQRCDDALTDPRADIDACGQLGVRSVMVLPLILKEKLVGVFEVFSAEPFAFSEREERTAEAFAHRIVKNLERAAEPLEVVATLPAASAEPMPVSQENSYVPPAVLQSLHAGLEDIDPGGDEFLDEKIEPKANRGLEILTWMLAAAVLICILLVGQRFILRRVASRPAAPAKTASGAPIGSANANSEISSAQKSSSSAAPSPPAAVPLGNSAKSAMKRDSASNDSAAVGSLSVYENGREVFHIPPSQASPGDAGAVPSPGVEPASSIESESIVQISPEAAEGSLLRRVEPEYPEEARQQQIQGAVVLDVRIAPGGAVEEVNVVSGETLLAEAATNAVKQWRFRPRTSRGGPVEMQTRITLNFKLPQ